jgi:hypothetical protein
MLTQVEAVANAVRMLLFICTEAALITVGDSFSSSRQWTLYKNYRQWWHIENMDIFIFHTVTLTPRICTLESRFGPTGRGYSIGRPVCCIGSSPGSIT